MQKGPTLHKQKQQQWLLINLSMCVHATTLQNNGLTKICEEWVTFIWQRRKKKKNEKQKQKNTAKQKAKIIVY